MKKWLKDRNIKIALRQTGLSTRLKMIISTPVIIGTSYPLVKVFVKVFVIFGEFYDKVCISPLSIKSWLSKKFCCFLCHPPTWGLYKPIVTQCFCQDDFSSTGQLSASIRLCSAWLNGFKTTSRRAEKQRLNTHKKETPFSARILTTPPVSACNL